MDDLFNNDALPVHVGIIMDGNGRWAKKRNLLRTNGHTEGLKRAKEIAKAAYEGSIFEAAEKIHKTVTKDIPEKILKESQTWGWVKKLQKFFGIKPENEGQKPENK